MNCLALSMLAAGFLVTSIGPGMAASPPGLGLQRSTQFSARKVFELTNRSRTDNGLPAFVLDPRLSEAARVKLADMRARNYFSHADPEGDYVWGDIARAGCDYGHVAENLAAGYADEAEMQRGWMNSRIHRENVLDPRHTRIGIAVSQSPQLAVVLFADTCRN